mgnify:CR=1 FL=1
MSLVNTTHETYSFVKCQGKAHIAEQAKESAMFSHLMSQIQTRRSTKFLLDRSDDRLLADIGLTRADIEAMHLGHGPVEARTKAFSFPALPFRLRLPA